MVTPTWWWRRYPSLAPPAVVKTGDKQRYDIVGSGWAEKGVVIWSSCSWRLTRRGSSRSSSEDVPRTQQWRYLLVSSGLGGYCQQVLWWLPSGGKQPCRSLGATTDLRTKPSRLLTFTDSVSRLSYLIDTGAEISVLPPSTDDRRHPSSGLKLQGANGFAIRTYGERSVRVDIGLAKSFIWTFTIAEVSKPIIGADFLRHFGLLVDLGRKRLMDAETFLTVPASYGRSSVCRLSVLVEADCFSGILEEFKEVTVPCIKICRLQGKVEHQIDTRCHRPVFARARRLSPEKLAVAKGSVSWWIWMSSDHLTRHGLRHFTWWPSHLEDGARAAITERSTQLLKTIAIPYHTSLISRHTWKGRQFSPR